MAVSITSLQGQDGVGRSRLTINQNFSALKMAVDASQLLLDPATSILTGVKSATINDTALPLSNVIFTVGKASALLGNVTMGTTAQPTTVLVNGNGGFTIDSSNLNLTSGNLNVQGANSLATFVGHVSVGKEMRIPGVSTAFAAPSLTGSVLVAGKSYVVLANQSIPAGATVTLLSGTNGQIVDIVYGPSGATGYPSSIETANFAGLTGYITMTQKFDSIKVVYEGSSWYLLSYSPASFATSGTTSSITFTTI